MKGIILRDEPNFVKVIMEKYADGGIEFFVYREYSKDEVIYLTPDAVKIMKANLN